MHRDERYGEKLATPDITIADLIGEVDPIKVAEGRYLSDELTIHYGLIPRTNRGIFAINELPDLAERIQVGLLNVMEERDIQIRGHRVRLPLDVFIVATANPEDYTNRGRIITPLKDRYGAQIRTHYPRRSQQEIEIMEQEADIARHRRLSRQRAGVHEGDRRRDHPARPPIAGHQPALRRLRPRVASPNYEALLANALRRALRAGETEVVPRISDLPFVVPALQGKVEFETMEDGKEDAHHGAPDSRRGQMRCSTARTTSNDARDRWPRRSRAGCSVETGRRRSPPTTYAADRRSRCEGLSDVFPRSRPATRARRCAAAAIEFILEGLHLHKLLNKYDTRGTATLLAGSARPRLEVGPCTRQPTRIFATATVSALGRHAGPAARRRTRCSRRSPTT